MYIICLLQQRGCMEVHSQLRLASICDDALCGDSFNQPFLGHCRALREDNFFSTILVWGHFSSLPSPYSQIVKDKNFFQGTVSLGQR